MIEPPDGLPWSAESLAAWRRITNKLLARGLWEPMYSTPAFVAATQAAVYCDCVRLHGVQAEVTEETRYIAREWLCDMLYLDRVLTARLDERCVDLDLVALCEVET